MSDENFDEERDPDWAVDLSDREILELAVQLADRPSSLKSAIRKIAQVAQVGVGEFASLSRKKE